MKVEGTLYERGNIRGRDGTEIIHLRWIENHTKWGQDHQEALSKGSRDLSVVKLPNASEVPFGEV